MKTVYVPSLNTIGLLIADVILLDRPVYVANVGSKKLSTAYVGVVYLAANLHYIYLD